MSAYSPIPAGRFDLWPCGPGGQILVALRRRDPGKPLTSDGLAERMVAAGLPRREVAAAMARVEALVHRGSPSVVAALDVLAGDYGLKAAG